MNRSKLYQALSSGELGFTVEQRFAHYPHLGGVAVYGNPFQSTGMAPPEGILPAHRINLG
jgi:hypothetical protein